jgi:hypothetical protein
MIWEWACIEFCMKATKLLHFLFLAWFMSEISHLHCND